MVPNRANSALVTILIFVIEKYAKRLLIITYPNKTLFTHAGFNLLSFHTENTGIKEVNNKSQKRKTKMDNVNKIDTVETFQKKATGTIQSRNYIMQLQNKRMEKC